MIAPQIRGIVAGLRFMHRLKVIHGDLKASNVLVDAGDTCRLSDFGLTTITTCAIEADSASETTFAGWADGTIRWMAPGPSALSR
jgi:serine/threonine protein kinase